jgi:hypothetical protein
LAVGTIDALYLFGERPEGQEISEDIPEKGYGMALAGGWGNHEWCVNEIPGVTDNMPLLGIARGKKVATEEIM